MAKRKKVNLDKELEKQVAFDYPKVKNPPLGYPPLLGLPGRTWYERACAYEKKYNKRVEKKEVEAQPLTLKEEIEDGN